jgi:hypothetical protein
MFGIVIAVTFQSVFGSKMHQDNVFSFLKNSFLTSAHQNNPKT